MHIPTWLANFSGYWKEASVILTGLFAVLGLAGEYKDKDTGRLTGWGRTFLVLTVVSMGFGLIAQIQDNKDSDRLLERTQKSVHQLSRIIQAFDEPTISVMLEINCKSVRFKDYCSTHLAEKKHRMQAGGERGLDAPYSTKDLPGGPQVILQLFVHFFKDKRESDEVIANGLILNNDSGDTTAELFLTNYADEANLQVLSLMESTFEIVGSKEKAAIHLQNQKIISIADLPGSTVVVTAGSADSAQLNGLKLAQISLTTRRGQEVDIFDLTPVLVDGNQIFVHTFPTAPAAEDE